MELTAKLNAWVAAGLIDAATADRIRDHEAEAGRPVLLWAVSALGLLALGLGIILVTSANWDRIADWVKLVVHLVLLASALATVWWASRRPARRWTGEAALFLAAVLLLAGQALHAQIYQLSGPAWHLLIGWLVVMSPLILLAGSSWLTGIGWSLMLLVGLASMATDVPDEGAWLLAQGLALAAPAALLALHLVPGVGRPPFRAAIRAAGLATLLAGASLVHLAWASAVDAAEARLWAIRLVPAGVVTALALLLHRRWPGDMPAPLFRAVLAGPLLATFLALALPHPDQWSVRFLGLWVFAAMWGWIGWAASRADWGGLFGVAIAAIAVRIFLIYIEVFGSLAATGLGLMGGGLLLVALGFGWRRLVGRRRP